MSVKTDVNYRITGPCLSLLLRDCECSVSDQMGFLVGEKSSITTSIISDAEMQEEKIETTVSINGTFPIGLPFLFCSSLGRVDEKSLKEILGNCAKDVVGWYTFRRNSNHGPLLRECLLHRELCKILNHMPHEYFVFCVLTTTENDRSATHCNRFTFSTSQARRFQPVSVVQTNLGEPEDNMYKSSTEINNSSKYLQEVLCSLNGVNNSKMAMTTLHREMNRHVETLQNRVSVLESEINHHMQRIDSCNFSCSVIDQKSSRGDESSPSTSSKMKPSELSGKY